MSEIGCCRRQFLAATSVAAATAWTCSTRRLLWGDEPDAPAATRPLRLGAPVFDAPEDPAQLALAHRRLGLRAAYCPAVELTDATRIADIRRGFAEHDVVIAEVGRWNNLLAADPDERRRNLEYVTQGLALADEVGALCCVNIAGTFSQESWFGPHPDNLTEAFFDAAVENARHIIDAVRPKRAKFCYEMMGWALPDSPASCLRIIQAVDRPGFAAHLDPCNLINSPTRFYRTTELLNECFDVLAPWIVSCHAKDVTWNVGMQVHFEEVPIGAGVLDYATYLRRLTQLPRDVPLMVEHMKDAAEYERSCRRVTEVGTSLGIRFS